MLLLRNDTLGIAVVDDDTVYRSFLTQLLVKGTNFRVFEAASGEALNRILDSEIVDCIVLDYNLGAESGFSVKERLVGAYQVVPPIVMLTGDGRESTVIKALRLGINDYLPKRDLKASGLISAITQVVQSDRDARREKAELERLAKLSGIDIVTGIPGRNEIESRLTQIAALPAHARRMYGLVLVEFTDLPAIIERFGLKAGEQALRIFADRIKAACRLAEIYGRYSDNSFLIVADVRGNAERLKDIGARIYQQVAQPIRLPAAQIDPSAGIGCVRCEDVRPGEAVAPLDLMEAAQAALAAAKSSAIGVAETGARLAEPAIPTSADEPADASAAAPPRTTNRRKEPRQRVLKRGHIVLPLVNGAVDCTVRNLSSHGAGLRIDAAFAVPAEITLVIPTDGTKRRARLCWQVGTNLGVEFLD
jgi:diguanylate cyclase (GGDEF)-like protein